MTAEQEAKQTLLSDVASAANDLYRSAEVYAETTVGAVERTAIIVPRILWDKFRNRVQRLYEYQKIGFVKTKHIP